MKKGAKKAITIILATIGVTLVAVTLISVVFNVNGTMFGDVIYNLFTQESKPDMAEITPSPDVFPSQMVMATDVPTPKVKQPLPTPTAGSGTAQSESTATLSPQTEKPTATQAPPPTPTETSTQPPLVREIKSLTRDGLTLTDGTTYTGTKLGENWFVYELPGMVKYTIGDNIMSFDTDRENSEYISGAAGTAVDNGKAIRYKSGSAINVRRFTVWFTPDSEYYVESISRDGVLKLSNGTQFQGVRVEETAADYTAFAFSFENSNNLPYMATYMLDDSVLDLDTDPAVSEFLSGNPGAPIDNGAIVRYKSGAVIKVQAFTIRLR
jgi:hypothetical protein